MSTILISIQVLLQGFLPRFPTKHMPDQNPCQAVFHREKNFLDKQRSPCGFNEKEEGRVWKITGSVAGYMRCKQDRLFSRPPELFSKPYPGRTSELKSSVARHRLLPKTCISCFQKERLKLYYQRLIETLKAFHMHQFECDKK